MSVARVLNGGDRQAQPDRPGVLKHTVLSRGSDLPLRKLCAAAYIYLASPRRHRINVAQLKSRLQSHARDEPSLTRVVTLTFFLFSLAATGIYLQM